jgi:phage gp46-like protein
MPDISTFWQPEQARGDWALAGADLAAGGDLATAVLISLFTDRRADPDDVIPDGSNDPRGWWGDTGRDTPIGSRLWLLEREKRTEAVRLRAEDYIGEALQWLLDDGVASSIEVVAQWALGGRLDAMVVIVEPTGRRQVFNYQWAWKGVN